MSISISYFKSNDFKVKDSEKFKEDIEAHIDADVSINDDGTVCVSGRDFYYDNTVDVNGEKYEDTIDASDIIAKYLEDDTCVVHEIYADLKINDYVTGVGSGSYIISKDKAKYVNHEDLVNPIEILEGK